MSKSLRNYIFGKNRGNPVAAAVAKRAEKIVLAYKNFNYDFNTNGEKYFLRDVVAKSNPRVIFDVGANDGEWAALAAQYCPDAEIHAFEIVPSTADICAAKTGSIPRIHLNRIGLSDAPGQIDIRTYDGMTTHASMHDMRHTDSARIVSCAVMRGDDYVYANGIAKIDLLKIDVEGAENKVIQGFIESLRAGKIDAIQFEYGRANILSKFLLKDWYDLLAPLGYRIGKLYPDHIDFKPYDLRDEDFIGPNYIAAR